MDDEQARADRFFAWVQSGEWDKLVGKSAAEILALVGPPSEIWTLDRDGHHWLQAVYRFEAIPSQFSDDERCAHSKGMHFTPTLLFRDGECVPQASFDSEVLGGKMTATPPRDVNWQPGRSFP
jgi:hypothetical protein